MTLSDLHLLFSAPADPALLNYGSHNPALVALSLLVAIFSSWMALRLAGQAHAATSRLLRNGVLLSGSLALGMGVWAMHFIGMLAFDLCTTIVYSPGLTLLSLLPSVAASFVALSLLARHRLSVATLLTGGLLMGAGIGAMHYTGMAAMRMGLALRYDPAMFALSLVVAVGLATLALWVRFGLRLVARLLGESAVLAVSAVVMGCAIAGMHYTGMAAARFVGTPTAGAAGGQSTFLALATSLATICFIVVVVAANGWLRYRQMFRQVAHSESWMRALLTTTIDAVITVDAAGVVEEFNAAAERMFGWRRNEIVGRQVQLLMVDQQFDVPAALSALLYRGDGDGGAGQPDRASDLLACRQDGSMLPVRCAVGHARVDERNLFVLFITDISERRAMVQALRDSEQQFRGLIGNIPGISYRMSLRGEQQMVYLSDEVERLTGYPYSDFFGPQAQRRLMQMVVEEDQPQLRAAIERAMAGPERLVLEHRLRHADGSIRWVLVKGAVARDAAGVPEWLDGVILDITERQQMEQALRLAKDKAEQAAEARASFVANISHEIRTPMNSILGFTDVLLESELQPDQRHHLDTVRSAGRSLLRLLNEVLDTAKLDKGAVELELTDYSLLALIDELSSTVGARAQAKGLLLDLRYDPALPLHLHGDELRMRQVLGNLLDNAIKFTATGSVGLKVGPSADGARLCLDIHDTGIGIAPERLDAIFEAFTQADVSTTRAYGGTGLGTTICRQLVNLMGGRIWASSAVGRGTTFHVELPLMAAREVPRPRAGRGGAFSLPPLHILAADDVPQNLELLALLLEKRGHTLEIASDGVQAVALAAAVPFDVILMDVQMPILDGLAATRAIRAAATRAGRPQIPVVAMTASVLEAHRTASVDAGMDGFASKPVEWAALSHEIARVLGLAGSDVPIIWDGAGEGMPGAAAVAAPANRIFNLEAGLRRWSGHAAAFQMALRRFEADYGSLAQQLTALLGIGGGASDYPGAAALAHKARGAAANLGLEQLTFTLGQLEQFCSDGERAQVSGKVQQLGTQVAAALYATATAFSAAPADASAAADASVMARHGAGPAQPVTPLG